MDNKKLNIKYTESGLKELDNFKKEQVEYLEEYLISERYVFGDDEIEITSSDIKEFKEKIRIVSNRKPFRSSSLKLAAILYTFIGIVTTIVGLSYGYFEELLKSNKEQAMISLVGIMISFLGIFLGFYLRLREKRYMEIEKRGTTLYKRNAGDSDKI